MILEINNTNGEKIIRDKVFALLLLPNYSLLLGLSGSRTCPEDSVVSFIDQWRTLKFLQLVLVS